MLEYVDFQVAFVLIFWAVIFIRGLKQDSYQYYGVFYFYVTIEAVSGIVALVGATAWGVDDQRYLNLYIVTELAVKLAQAVFLAWLILLPRGFRPRSDLPPLAISLAISVSMELGFSTQISFWHLARASSFFLFLVALQAVYRCFSSAKFQIGANMGVALGAVFIVLSLKALNSSLSLARFWGYDAFGNFLEFAGVASWGAIAWGMWDLDKPKWLQ